MTVLVRAPYPVFAIRLQTVMLYRETVMKMRHYERSIKAEFGRKR